MNEYSRINYRENLSTNVEKPKINPVDRSVLNKKIAEYEKAVSNIPIWPFISLINWKLINTAEAGQNNCTFKLSELIRISESSVDDQKKIIKLNTLHTLRVALIDDYYKKIADYYKQSNINNMPENYFKRLAWLYNHNRFNYNTKAHEKAGNEWKKAMELYGIDSSVVILIRDAVKKDYSKFCTTTKIVFNDNSKFYDLLLGFNF